jgi:peptide/nickel transport system substrate-binding protein
MTRRFFQALCAFLVPVLLLSGCWQEAPPEELALQPEEEEEEVQPTGTVLPEVFSLPYAPGLTLDPVTCPDGMQQVVSSLLCEGLFRLGPDLAPVPWLCESYSYDAASYTYTLTLRKNVFFSDGSPLSAADVKATLDRARKSQRYGTRLADVTAVTAGAGTVTIALSGPNTGLPALLDIPIVKSGTQDRPIGTGPYLLSSESSGDWLIANQSWWQDVSLPLDRIALVEASDQDTMLYRFTSHDVQLITADLTGTTPIAATGNVTYRDANTTILQYLGCNTAKAPLNDPALRRCLWQGIDRAQLVSAFLSSHGQASQFPVSPLSPLYPADLEAAYSAAALSASLAELSVPRRTLTLLVNEENSFKVSAAQQIAKAFTAGGLSVSVKALPWAEYTAALAAGNFDLYYGEVRLTADWDLSPLLASGGALNYGGWSNPQTDALLELFSAAEDRPAVMRRLCAHLRDLSPILPICFKSTSVLVQANVLDGLTPTMAEPLYNLPLCTVHLQKP